ncbi:hypothetical protein M432DRAFT_623795 [Thermoascus aurantiacus ATCC 26904]
MLFLVHFFILFSSLYPLLKGLYLYCTTLWKIMSSFLSCFILFPVYARTPACPIRTCLSFTGLRFRSQVRLGYSARSSSMVDMYSIFG